ncbi:MAG: alpha/beta hydrolase [Mycobacteriaceae bacterium]|nr:alpha/beta hydrolase [Mycobacteriaceae bacterium]
MTQDNSSDLELKELHANGLQFSYLESGLPEQPLVIVLHGFPDTAWSFVELIHLIAAAGYRVVAPMLRGYTSGAVPVDGDYSVPTLGRDVVAIADALGAPKCYVIGHDWGAAAAYAAAGLHPERVERLVTVSVPHLRRFLFRPTVRQTKASHYIYKFQVPGWPERRIPKDDFSWLRALAESWSPGWQAPDAYFEPVRRTLSDPRLLRAALGYYRALPALYVDRTAWRHVFQPLRVPTQVIHGADDRCILPAAYRGAESLFPAGYRAVEMPGAGHFLHLEAPSRLAETIVDFLDAPSPAPE